MVVLISVLLITVLSLLRVNVIIAIIAAGIVAGLMSGISITDSITMLVNGMGDQANTALSYILLGAFAVAISYTGITSLLVNYLIRVLTGKKTMIVLVIAGVACLSQNLVPVHIAFIPILIPPLLKWFDKMRMDRRAIATALTFGLKAPYVMIPVGYGLLFHQTIVDAMYESGLSISISESALAMLIPGLGMVVGLLIAVFITYRKDRDSIPGAGGSAAPNVIPEAENVTFNKKHVLTLVAILGAFIVQVVTGNLILGALTGLILMFLLLVVPYHKGDQVMTEGISMMGFIAFIMLVASGYGAILENTGAIDQLVELFSGVLAENQALIAIILLFIGLIVTIGIGSSFGTIPIIAALYVPICMAAGFSPMATAALVGTAGALGDAGSPASESTVAPSVGLNADGKHNHIWDTCVPTFIHFNIPLFIFGWAAAMIL